MHHPCAVPDKPSDATEASQTLASSSADPSRWIRIRRMDDPRPQPRYRLLNPQDNDDFRHTRSFLPISHLHPLPVHDTLSSLTSCPVRACRICSMISLRFRTPRSVCTRLTLCHTRSVSSRVPLGMSSSIIIASRLDTEVRTVTGGSRGSTDRMSAV